MFGLLKKIFGSAQDRTIKQYKKIMVQVNEWDQKYLKLSDNEVRAKTDEFRARIAKGESVDDLLVEAYGLVKNACRRFCGTEVHVSGYNQKWDMVPFDVQILGAIALHKGAISEMQTGEGKTLTAVMPLYLNSLTRKPVHLVTVNDYLADRDAQWTGSVLRWLGLTTGILTNSVPPHERKAVYQCDVVYGTASEFGFDYLRDNSMASRKEEQVQRGYYFAVIDEIDSILIDEARTPLIISGPAEESRQMYDVLENGVRGLVKTQRDLCNRLATEAWKTLKGFGYGEDQPPAPTKRSKAEQEEIRGAFHKLWLVSKGAPRTKMLKRAFENPDMRAAIDEWDLYYYTDQNKQDRSKALAELYMIVDEKGNEYELTDKGIGEWSHSDVNASADDFTMLDLSHEYMQIDEDTVLSKEERLKRKEQIREEDIKRKERAHNLRQLLRAHLLMEKDVDYIVQENKIVIIDENTGRPQPGRRFSDGLHSAIEAKESVPIQKETQTYATITLQNFFRMYEKLAGMTGTASTEAGEFKEIYKLEVLEIPTNKPCNRKRLDDQVYMSEREKYHAILKEVKEIHTTGRPILIGTESVDISEKLSRIFRQHNVPHEVLNAKNHANEAEIIANAGQKAAITISTNMAGRGTDIKLGQGVAELGGLHVLGTTRHPRRSIDRQLEGRSARQGDPGTAQFFLSFEDKLLRFFASPKITSMLQRFRPPENEPISAPILNRSISTAQKRIEQRNYMVRKHTLEYDDVMNKQRQEIYAFRNDILHTQNPADLAIQLLEDLCYSKAEFYFSSKSDQGSWDPQGFREWLMEMFPIFFEETAFDDDYIDRDGLAAIAYERVKEAFVQKIDGENRKGIPDGAKMPVDGMRDLPADRAVRGIMIRRLDKMWKDHLLSMDHLRSEVTMRAVAQKDPLVEFKYEAFRMFDELGDHLREEIAKDLFRFQVVRIDESMKDLLAKLKLETQRSLSGEMEGEGAQQRT